MNSILNRSIFSTANLNASKQEASTKGTTKAAKPTAAATQSGQTVQSKDYFGYDKYSYFDIENEMLKYRLPQPSALPKNEFTYSQLPPKQKQK